MDPVEDAIEKFWPHDVISPSLLKPEYGDLTKFKFNPAFDLGYNDWIEEALALNCLGRISDLSVLLEDDEREEPTAESDQAGRPGTATASADSAPPQKRLKLSSTKPQKTLEPLQDVSNTRFGPLVTSPEREKAAKGVVPENTQTNTRWALRNFNAWALNRTICHPDEAVPDLLECCDPGILCKWLCRFILETRREDGKPYPPSTLRLLISGINCALKAKNVPFSVLDKSDYRFCDLQKTLDFVGSELHRQGIGATKKSAQVIDPKHEDLFWEKGLLGLSSPKVLQVTLFFILG